MRLAVLTLLVLSGCAPPRRAASGTACERNSDCAAPLVCRIGFCRNECATSADCPAGLSCLLDGMPGDPRRFGACQLAEEATCTLQSECPEGLVCRFGQCTNACNADRDCPGGASCLPDPRTMANACLDASTTPCTLDSECGAGEFCLSGRCRRQCYADRDCGNGWTCAPDGTCTPPTDDAAPVPTDTPDALGRCGTAPLSGVADFALGGDFGCAISTDPSPSVFCWGDDMANTLGRTTTMCAEPVAELAGADVVDVQAADTTVCVRLSSGQVQCMGQNFHGTLGRGAPGSAGGVPFDPVPTPIAGPLASALFAGSSGDRFFLLDAAGDPWGWGENSAGAIGDGSTTARGTPVRATGYLPTSVFASGSYACAIAGATTRCLGVAPIGTPPTGMVGAAVGRGFACVHDGTTVQCVADSVAAVDGVLGDATTAARTAWAPTRPLPAAIRDLRASDRHVCALLVSGEVWCWGSRLAFDPSGADEAVMIPELAVTGADAVDCGIDSTCVLRAGQVLCAGRYGRALGIGTTARPPDFTQVLR